MHKNHYFRKSHKIQKLIIIFLFDFLFHIYLCTKTNTKYEMWSQNREKPIRIKQKTMNAKKKKIHLYILIYDNQIKTLNRKSQNIHTSSHMLMHKKLCNTSQCFFYMYTHMYAHICKCFYASTYMYIHIRLRLTQFNSIQFNMYPLPPDYWPSGNESSLILTLSNIKYT